MLIRILLISLALFSASSIAKTKSTPIVSGYMYEHSSAVLNQSRRYMVSLPERYHSDQRHYPTIYVIDSDFQFQHTSALVTNLSRMGKIPPMIVIGVANQGQKDYIYHTTWPSENNNEYGGAQSFYNYIEQELVPLINKNYRTNSQQALAGYSLGGLFTTYVMMQKNTSFNAFLAMSPSAWFDNHAITTKLPLQLSKNKQAFAPLFISVANEKEMGVRKLVDALKKSTNKELANQWQFKTYPEETHFSTAMPALYDALTFLSPNFYVDPQDMMKLDNYKEVLSLFEKKKSYWTGFHIEWLQAYQLAKYMFWSKQLEDVDDFLKAIFKQFPASHSEVTIQVAKGFIIKKQPKRAQELLLSIKATSQNNAMWHREMSLSYEALGEKALAKSHQKQTMDLAKKQKLPTWLVWELQ